MEYKYLSFFSGALGLDLGLEQAGMKCLAVNEFDKQTCETIKKNKPDLKLYDCDIRELSAKKLMADLNLQPRELFAIVGGPPCQAFSTAGKRMGLADERGNVFLHFINIIKGLKPQYVVIENVRGLLSAPLDHVPHKERDEEYGNRYEHIPGGALFYIVQKLKQAGYTVSFNLYDTSYFGVPQKRERIVMLASLNKVCLPYLNPSHDGVKVPFVSVAQALNKVVAKEYLTFNAKRISFLKKIKPGGNWKNLSLSDQKKAMGESFNSGGGKTGFFRRLSWDKPSPTLVTSPCMPATLLAHPKENRPLSVEEYAAIQTFPKNFIFTGSTLYKYKQIGNAVPCLFGKKIGEHLISFHNNQYQEPKSNTTFSRYKNTDHISWLKNFKSQIKDG